MTQGTYHSRHVCCTSKVGTARDDPTPLLISIDLPRKKDMVSVNHMIHISTSVQEVTQGGRQRGVLVDVNTSKPPWARRKGTPLPSLHPICLRGQRGWVHCTICRTTHILPNTSVSDPLNTVRSVRGGEVGSRVNEGATPMPLSPFKCTVYCTHLRILLVDAWVIQVHIFILYSFTPGHSVSKAVSVWSASSNEVAFNVQKLLKVALSMLGRRRMCSSSDLAALARHPDC